MSGADAASLSEPDESFHGDHVVMKLIFDGGIVTTVAAATLVLAACLGGCARDPEPPVAEEAVHTRATPPENGVREVLEQIETLDETVWKQERLAQEYEQTFVALWDRLRPAEDKFEPLAEFPFEAISLGKPGGTSAREDGVTVRNFVPGGQTLDPAQWREFLKSFQDQGFEIVETEWHHSHFDAEPLQPVRSTISFKINARHPETATRYVVRGDLKVLWSDQSDEEGHHRAAALDAGTFTILEHTGPPRFEAVLKLDPRDGDPPRGVTSTLLYDLNHDGLPELVLPGQNRVFWNRGDFQFEPEVLCEELRVGGLATLIADLTGDGIPDLLTTPPGRGLYLVPGNSEGRFTKPARLILAAPSEDLKMPMTLTAGDIDADGDLDVWLGQWMDPYTRAGGKMPAKYYDANDSHPSFLLVNDGQGHFADATGAMGLGAKRRRRTFSASFADLDEDRDLDLVVVSDFAGVDVYLNDGSGHFADVTDQVIDETYNFGMSLTLADFNLDRRLDFLVVGMSSTTARRLDGMGLAPSFRKDVTAARGKMGYGNRLYLGGDGKFTQAPFNDHIARSGWSWGSTALDFDNDGDQDVYVANGFWSGDSAKDYCTRFWCHDIYLGGDETKPAATSYFDQLSIFPEWSWNPFEKNCLFINESGRDFFEAGFLMDVAMNIDARQVVSGDLNADGHVDLIVGQVVLAQEPHRSYVHVLRNLGSLEGERNWIGVHLDDRTPGVSPIGAVVRVKSPEETQTAYVVTGDAYLAQHSLTRHFGLGSQDSVDTIEVQWPNGTLTRLDRPEINTYHTVRPGGE